MDSVIAIMEAGHPHSTTQKSFYVEISRARYRAELVTDDRKALGEHLEVATGERVVALEAVEPRAEHALGTAEVLGGDLDNRQRGPDREVVADEIEPKSTELDMEL